MAGADARPFWRRWLLEPLVAQLRQGIAPDEIALTLAFAATLGVFPILGTTTLLCAAVAAVLRLNQPLMQLANYLVYPAQLALLLPFCRAGEWLLGQPGLPVFSAGELAARLRAGPLQFLIDYGLFALGGVAAWTLVAPVCAAAIYFALRPPLRRLARRRSISRAG